MVAIFLHRALGTHVRELPDGRSVTVRRAVPSDAPRLAALGTDTGAGWGCEIVALDDHGAIVAHAVSAEQIVVAHGWARSGLHELLAAEAEGS
jgi:hypothetical protein